MLPENGLALNGFAAALPASGRDARVTMMLGLKESRQALAKPDGRLADDITYAVFVVDIRSGKTVKSAGNTAKVMSSAPRAGAGDDVAFQIPIELTLPPGQYQLRFTATSQATRAGGSVYLTMDVPDFTAKKLTMSGLVLGYANGAHQAIAQAPPGLVSGAPRPSRLPLVPSLDRSYSTSEALRFYAEFTRAGAHAPVQASVDILDEAGHAAVHSTHTIPAAAPARLDVTCPLAGLARGNYRLHVTISDGAATAERDVAFAVK
jgi:hypothetical protein